MRQGQSRKFLKTVPVEEVGIEVGMMSDFSCTQNGCRVCLYHCKIPASWREDNMFGIQQQQQQQTVGQEQSRRVNSQYLVWVRDVTLTACYSLTAAQKETTAQSFAAPLLTLITFGERRRPCSANCFTEIRWLISINWICNVHYCGITSPRLFSPIYLWNAEESSAPAVKLCCSGEIFALFARSRPPVDKDKVVSGGLSWYLKQRGVFLGAFFLGCVVWRARWNLPRLTEDR